MYNFHCNILIVAKHLDQINRSNFFSKIIRTEIMKLNISKENSYKIFKDQTYHHKINLIKSNQIKSPFVEKFLKIELIQRS